MNKNETIAFYNKMKNDKEKENECAMKEVTTNTVTIKLKDLDDTEDVIYLPYTGYHDEDDRNDRTVIDKDTYLYRRNKTILKSAKVKCKLKINDDYDRENVKFYRMNIIVENDLGEVIVNDRIYGKRPLGLNKFSHSLNIFRDYYSMSLDHLSTICIKVYYKLYNSYDEFRQDTDRDLNEIQSEAISQKFTTHVMTDKETEEYWNML